MEVTAPGKVLLLGGYAVHEFHPALSIALTDGNGLGVVARGAVGGTHRIISKEYCIDSEIALDKPAYYISKATTVERYSFCAYQITAAYLRSKGKTLQPTKIELSNSKIFGGKDEKSGLGSSAASTVALVACLLECNGMTIEENRELINKLAQLSNHIASEKTGSGFDTATSTFGSIQYVRFAKEIFNVPITEENFDSTIAKIVDGQWAKMKISPFSLKGYDLALFNIKGGKTSTISSLKAVKRLIEYTPELYQNFITKQALAEASVMDGIASMNDQLIRRGMHSARGAQRSISQWIERVGMLSFDPIEPQELTQIIEKAEDIEGVVAGRCPGAGGYDSVAFLVKAKDDELIGRIKAISARLEYIDTRTSIAGVKRN